LDSRIIRVSAEVGKHVQNSHNYYIVLKFGLSDFSRVSRCGETRTE